jgi:hypothetical protein
MSILLATTILALGGLGIYMYKSTDTTKKYEDDFEEDYNEKSIFGGNFWGLKDDKEEENNDLEEEYDLGEEEDFKPRKKNNVKTHRNKKSTGTSKRRH